MKLRNKKTGEWAIAEIVDDRISLWYEDGRKVVTRFDSLAELNEEWEDYEEPKEHYFISEFGFVYCVEHVRMDKKRVDEIQAIGNYFNTREEAEKAVEKLKAWKRLKDAGFEFEGRCKPNYGENFAILCKLPKDALAIDVAQDLDLLFGGKE